MGRLVAGGSRIYVDEFDYSGVVNSIGIDTTNVIADVTAFSDTDATLVEGKPGFSITLNGLYSASSPDYDGEMFADLTSSDRLITISPSIAAATGGVCYFGQGDITSMPITSAIGDAVLLNVTWNGNKPLTRGKFGYVDTAMVETGSGTGYELGKISTTKQLIMFQHVLSVSGTNTPTITTTVYSDTQADMLGSASLIATFTGVTDVTGATSEREVAVTASDDTFYRATFTISGTDPSFSVIFAMGLADYQS